MMCPTCNYRATREADLAGHMQAEHGLMPSQARRRARAVAADRAMNGDDREGVATSIIETGTRPTAPAAPAPVEPPREIEFARRPEAMIRTSAVWTALLKTLKTDQAIRWRGRRETLNGIYSVARSRGHSFHVSEALDGSYLAWLDTPKMPGVRARTRRPS